ncbi:MAG: hypothetical protein Q8S33_23140 [Myxococcales bacterium]|nr:hypothetical protein [Myxococcales bacterium]
MMRTTIAWLLTGSLLASSGCGGTPPNYVCPRASRSVESLRGGLVGSWAGTGVTVSELDGKYPVRVAFERVGGITPGEGFPRATSWSVDSLDPEGDANGLLFTGEDKSGTIRRLRLCNADQVLEFEYFSVNSGTRVVEGYSLVRQGR